jgi:putative inorganic carbon (hco3(-)) transporter
VKGLILTYIVAYSAMIAAPRYPLIGLYVYVGLAILRPQEIFAFAGDIRNLSLYVGAATLIGWALNGFGTWGMGRGRVVVSMFLLFLLLFTLSASLALDRAVAFNSLFEFSKLFLPFLAGITLINGEKDWRPLLWTIVLCQGYVGFEQNLNYVQGFNTAAAGGFGGMDNNFFGLSLVTTLGPAIALTLASRKWWSRLAAAVATGLILHTILLTFSRGAMIGLIAVGVVAFVMMPKRPKYLAALLVLVLVSARLTGPELFARYGTAFAPEEERDGSAQSRVDLWKDCLKVIEQHPALGVGPANWRTIAASYGWSPDKSAHSVWMETAAEVGVPGVLALLLFFGLTLTKLWPIARARQTDENRYEVAVASAVILAIVGFGVSGQFVSAAGLEVPYYITMVGIGVLRGKGREAVASTPKAIAMEKAAPSRLSFPSAAPWGGVISNGKPARSAHEFRALNGSGPSRSGRDRWRF